jgi:hypothetical protein
MASTPDPHPDSIPGGPSESPEQVSPADDHGRESVEDTPGTDGGTSGTGGTNHHQDRDVTS